MKCFRHREADAVGSYKACSKGLCGDCAVDVGKGLACRGECEGDVRDINQMIERNVKISPVSEELVRRQPRGYVAAGTLGVLAGIVFIFLGLDLSGVGRQGVVAIGVLVGVFGVWHLSVGLRLNRPPEPSAPRDEDAA